MIPKHNTNNSTNLVHSSSSSSHNQHYSLLPTQPSSDSPIDSHEAESNSQDEESRTNLISSTDHQRSDMQRQDQDQETAPHSLHPQELYEQNGVQQTASKWKTWFRRNFIALMTVIIPLGIALATRHVDTLVSFTGAFAGLFIQYVIPFSLVYWARKDQRVATYLSSGSVNNNASPHIASYSSSSASASSSSSSISAKYNNSLSEADIAAMNPHTSPFSHVGWIYFVGIWSAVSFVLTVYNQIRKWT